MASNKRKSVDIQEQADRQKVDRQKVDIERSKAIIEQKMLPRIDDHDQDTSSSSISMYNLDFDDEGTEFVSNRTPSVVRQITPPPVNEEEINNSPVIEKSPSERHCSANLVIPKEEHPSSYNIEEIFGPFTFDLHRREVSRKRFRKVKQGDGTMKEIQEEINNSPVTQKSPFERHCSANLVIPKGEHPSSYNIEKVFGSFTSDLHKKEVSRKRFRKVKQVDGTMKEIQEDEVLFEKTNEDPILVATASVALNQANIHNILLLNKRATKAESENQKLKDDIISLKEQIRKKRKVDDHLISLKENILEQQEKLHDVKVECFIEIQKMVDTIKALERHLEYASQMNQKMESLRVKIEELDRWRNIENIAPSGLPRIKAYDTILHTLAANECQELVAKFEEKVKQSLAGILKVYTKNVQDIQKDIQWHEINLQDEQPMPFAFFQKLEDEYEYVKAEVQSKELISKEDIQEFLIKPAKEISMYNAFIRKFTVGMEGYKECHLILDIKKEHIFNSQEQRILIQHEAWSKHVKDKGGLL